ncbi:MAG: BadF/BadG/BcrA/BcrD ATPase family protein [Pseudomonadota bacterium]
MPTELPVRAFVGIDGGATKTRTRAVTLDGNLIGEGVAGPGSLTLSPEIAAINCRDALLQALGASGVTPETCRVVCGMAGHRHPTMREAFEQRLADLGGLEVISDGYAALLGAHHGTAGGVVITGTGSVALRLDERGAVKQFGGFGPVCGDEGGGNWLGREAVREALRELDESTDGAKPMSPLAVALINHIGGTHEAILDWISRADATRFAELVPLIVRYGSKHDCLATKLLDEATVEICRLIQLVGRNDELPVAVVGGLARLLGARFSDEVRSCLYAPKGDAMDGAILRARGVAPPEHYG